MKQSIILSWSGGKDSALALHTLRTEGRSEVRALLTVMTAEYGRVSMHGIRREVLQPQAAALGLPVLEVLIHPQTGMAGYETVMRETLAQQAAQGVTAVAFGDIFLEDLKKYREDKLASAGLAAVFPLWKKDTAQLARQFIADGFRAVLSCVDTQKLPAAFAGREYDARLLADLPPGVDPCGENGEFHTLVYAGPVFSCPLHIARGESVLREERFCFCDFTIVSAPIPGRCNVPVGF
jgi:uncharacterized protein (TIGR00290 family)